MKRILIIFFQFLLMLVVFLVGSFLPVFHILPLWSVTTSPSGLFVLDGVYLLIFLYILLLAIGAARRRFPRAAINSTIALVLALIIGLASKFPFRSL
ncbi:hypothetical protein [Granulicella paludicola]|jgi:hypothetical protein|uniref:hypothetical protein n=1 Tax=Granulicella paludicola TaxID=474951 RepID=UPI0021DFDA16|nr:hypothetical protein [Granulicella paludicola]